MPRLAYCGGKTGLQPGLPPVLYDVTDRTTTHYTKSHESDVRPPRVMLYVWSDDIQRSVDKLTTILKVIRQRLIIDICRLLVEVYSLTIAKGILIWISPQHRQL